VPDILAPLQQKRETVPDILAPLTGQGPEPTFDENWMQRRNAFDRPPAPRPAADPTIFDPNQISQQRPLGDFTPQRPVQADFISEISRALRLPTRQNASVPPPSATPFPLAPEMARLLAPPRPGDAAPTLPRSLEDPSAAPAFGGRPSPLPFAPRTVGEQLRGLSPFAPSAGGSATQPPASASIPPERQQYTPAPDTNVPAQAAPAISPVAGGPNLSPFEQWPPPWWNFGGGDFGGGFGGGGFGGGYDFGAFA
jgi:hypothetical protein